MRRAAPPPNGTIERVKLQAWLNFIASELHKGGFSPLFYEGVPEAGKDVFRRRLKARFAHLRLLNRGRTFLCCVWLGKLGELRSVALSRRAHLSATNRFSPRGGRCSKVRRTRAVDCQ